MKLIMAIVNNDDSSDVLKALTKEGYQVTKLATTGGFLHAGNTTFILGIDEKKVEEAIHIIARFSNKRSQVMPVSTTYSTQMYSYPVEISVGGATVFVLNIERFEKF